MINISNYVLILMLMIADIKKSEQFLETDANKQYNVSHLNKFFFYYRDYCYVFHKDVTSTSINAASMMKLFPPYHLQYDGDFHNCGVGNRVNIFFVHNMSQTEIGLDEEKFFNQDGCNLFLTYEVHQEICSFDIVNLAPASFVFNVKSNQLFSCFTENEVRVISSVEEKKMDLLHLFHRSYSDLGGRRLKIYFLNNQATICRKIIDGKLSLVENGRCNPSGPEADLVRLLGKRMNFVPEFWLFEHDNLRKRWNKMIEAIGRSEAEFGVGSIFLAKDGPVYYTSFTHSAAQYVIYFVNPSKQLNLGKILISFDLPVYVISLLSLILILILVLTFTSSFSYQKEFTQCVFTLLKMVFEQGSNLSSRFYFFNTMKFILGLWLFFSIIFCTVLKSKIASALIKQETFDFKSVKDLSENNFSFVVLERFQESFIEKYGSYNVKISKGLRRNYENIGICPETLRLFQQRYAVVHGEFDLVVVIRLCKGFFPKHKINDQRFLLDSHVYYAMAMSPFSPYKKQFSYVIDLLKASGIMVHWYSYLNSHKFSDTNQELTPPSSFTMDHVSNVFILLLAGLGIGLVTFIMEIIISVYYGRQIIL